MRQVDDEVHSNNPDPNQDFLEIWEFRVDFATPANSTFTQAASVPVSEFESDLCGLIAFACFGQPTGNVQLDPLREVVMWRLQYINFGTHETLVGNFVTDVDGSDHGGVRWFELRKAPTDTSWSLYQEGTVAPDAADRWMGSIAMDSAGNIALGYNVVSSTIFPSLRYTGRLESDTLGMMTAGEMTIVDGSGSHFSNRWGDYSAMTVDPVAPSGSPASTRWPTVSGQPGSRISCLTSA
jgi:hypothetical protein